ncbi:hypothetical protein ACH9L7_14575 [Haloferax sp. S1W]|uniref:hypothetical protein n=1 Tax=Haloferax sp. S1W TaxID=3377110 RepID=UPI0037C52229
MTNAELESEPEVESEQERCDEDEEIDPAAHLKDLEDGAGCTEIWSHLSESREE